MLTTHTSLLHIQLYYTQLYYTHSFTTHTTLPAGHALGGQHAPLPRSCAALHIDARTRLLACAGGFWWFLLRNFPQTDLTSVQDATLALRLGMDGTPNSFSIQSVNYPTYFMTVQSDSYMQYSNAISPLTGSGTMAQKQAATFSFINNPDGSFNMSTHNPGMAGFTLGVGTANAHGCNMNSMNIRAMANPYYVLSTWLLNANGPLAAGSSYATLYTSPNVLLETLITGVSGGNYAYGGCVAHRVLFYTCIVLAFFPSDSLSVAQQCVLSPIP